MKSGLFSLSVKNRIEIMRSPLTYFTYYRGEDMNGSSHSVSVKQEDETHAVISYSDTDWHSQIPVVKEYLVSADILDELEKIFRETGMINWNQKIFSDISVEDGETESYSFSFGDSYSGVSFYSQYFPSRFSEKLGLLHEIIMSYTSDENLLPGLITGDNGDGESRDYVEGEVSLCVTQYRQNRFYFEFRNGTEEDLSTDWLLRLYVKGDDTPIFEVKYDMTFDIYSLGITEESIKLKERLSPGVYLLCAGTYGEYECEFIVE